MATYQQKTTSTDPHATDPVDPAARNVSVNQRNAASDSGMTGIIIAVVVLLIGAILAFNYGWFGGGDAPNVTQNNTTETVPPATVPETSSSTTAKPDTSTSTSTTTTTTEPAAPATGTTGTDTGTTTGTGTSTTDSTTTTTTDP